MQHPQAAWGHASGYTPDCRNRPRRAPAPPSLQAGIQVHRDALRHHEVVCQVYKVSARGQQEGGGAQRSDREASECQHSHFSSSYTHT